MAYVYLMLILPYAISWGSFFVLRPDLRGKLFLASLISALLGISEIWFVSEYWNPNIFQVIRLRENLFLESILFTFFLGGIVAISYQVLFKEKTFRFKKINPLLTLIAPLLFLSYFLRPLQINIMYYVFGSMLIGSFIVILYLGKTAARKILLSGLINTAFYSTIIIVLAFLFLEFPLSYNVGDLSGFMIGAFPVEEYLWIFSFSLYWTPLYEIWRTYVKSNKNIKAT